MTRGLIQALAVALLVASAAVRAEEARRSPLAAPPPIHSVVIFRASLFSGVPDLIGLSAEVTVPRPVVLEVGGSWIVQLLSYYARLGVAVPVMDGREKYGVGWTFDVSFLGGYRHLMVASGGGRSFFDYFTVNSAFDAVYWAESWLGLDFQAVVGGMIPFNSGGGIESSIPVVPDLRLAVGFTF